MNVMPTLEKQIKQRIFRGKKSRSGKTFHEKKLVGYLYAGIVDGKVGIGFSMCHKNDRWDIVKGIRTPGWGEHLAKLRVLKCAKNGEIEVPPSIAKKAVKFAARCQKCYKVKNMPRILKQSVATQTKDANHCIEGE
jgi:hypothetical protein